MAADSVPQGDNRPAASQLRAIQAALSMLTYGDTKNTSQAQWPTLAFRASFTLAR